MMELLPDLPGTITGIKCKDPFIVQCPTCGDCYTSRADWKLVGGLTHTKTTCRLPT